MTLLVALAAAVLERLAPLKLTTNGTHPVIWMGWLIARGERALNILHASFAIRRLAGTVLLAALLLLVGGVSVTIAWGLRSYAFGWWLYEAMLAAWLLAGKHLREAVAGVARPLHSGRVEAARDALSHIVGRDTANLETDEIARAAIETLAENASDGYIAPLFWLALFGLPGIALYKAINTADSMIGHKSERYLAFGWAAARLDDLVNLVPARLTALLFAAAAMFMRGADARAAVRTALRDAKKHGSPNAGWPESAMAGALGLGLGGPRAYHGERLDLPRMGDGNRDLNAGHIRRALRLYDIACWIVLIALALALAVWAGITLPALRP